VGVVLALPAGVSFAVGAQELVRLNFQAVSTNSADSPLAFADLPVVRQVSDPAATALASSYVGDSLSVNPVPVLSISQVGQKVSLSWPGWATNYLLQSSGNVGPAAVWSNAPAWLAVTNGREMMTVPVSGRGQFYRLYRQ
jgi:hypothetical protein